MGYKDMVLGQLTQTAINERDNVYFNMAQEVEEVYRKAKAFDRIVEIYSDNDHYSDEYVLETIQEQIDELERVDDEH
ncbi:hypothetical protein QI177_00460 [Staphylococcus saprophyticus]|nr:hypothetical protein [Staphylococcus saprophyticus]